MPEAMKKNAFGLSKYIFKPMQTTHLGGFYSFSG